MVTNKNAYLWLNVMVVLVTMILPAQAAAVIYNGPGNGDDVPAASVVDGNGNLYVTGKSWGGIGTGFDIATAKYSPAGRQIWVARYAGPGTDDIPSAIALDATGNIYVTGWSRANGDSDWDYVTIRYTPLLVPQRVGGIVVGFNEVPHQAWVQRYDYGHGNDRAVGIAVFSDRIYVTGNSWSDLRGREFATLAYDAATGNPLWNAARRYDEHPDSIISMGAAVGIGVNSAGEIFVTGTSGPFDRAGHAFDILTLRYAAKGAGPLVARSVGEAVALKVQGTSVYVAGWTVGAGNTRDFLTIKYNQLLEEQWHDIADAFGFPDYPAALAVDSRGRVYVAGYGIGNRGEFWNDYVILRYTSDGRRDTAWVYDGTPRADGNDVATAIVIDSSDNVYVTGRSAGENGQGYDYLTLKLSREGLFCDWSQRFTSANEQDDLPAAIAVEPNGNIYVTGQSPAAGQGQNFLMVKYSPNGTVLW